MTGELTGTPLSFQTITTWCDQYHALISRGLDTGTCRVMENCAHHGDECDNGNGEGDDDDGIDGDSGDGCDYGVDGGDDDNGKGHDDDGDHDCDDNNFQILRAHTRLSSLNGSISALQDAVEKLSLYMYYPNLPAYQCVTNYSVP